LYLNEQQQHQDFLDRIGVKTAATTEMSAGTLGDNVEL
jgi:hypothetical protein